MESAKRYRIAYKGLKNGVHDFEFKADGSLFEAEENAEIKGGDWEVRVRMNKTETMLELDVVISGYAVVECDRCLEDCRIPTDYDGHFVVKFSDETNDFDGEVMWIPQGEGELDLAHYIYESIVLSLPYRRIHPDGECNPEMLARFTAADAYTDDAPDEAGDDEE